MSKEHNPDDLRRLTTNNRHWDSRAIAHLSNPSEYYDIDGVIRGDSSLRHVELDLCGDVQGKTLLHAMCHIGLDSISWARLGAKVSGLDFSEQSICAAEQVAKQAGVVVDYRIGDVERAYKIFSDPFDRIVMTYGVLCWVRDIASLFRNFAKMLAIGGRFVLVDGHPLSSVWPRESQTDGFRPRDHSYFAEGAPRERNNEYSYGGGKIGSPSNYQWQHDCAEIIQSILDAGLILRTIREESFAFYGRYPGMKRRRDGYYEPPADMPLGLPLLIGTMAERVK